MGPQTGPVRVRRAHWISRRRALPLLLVAIAACGDPGPGGPAADDPAAGDGSRPYVFDLAENFALAERWLEPAEIVPGLFRDRRYLLRGWNFPGHVSDADEDASRGLWIDAPSAQVRLPLAAPGERELEFRIVPPQVPHRINQRLRVSLNGHPIADRLLPETSSVQSLRLPAHAQVAGINLLQLDFAQNVRLFEVVETSQDHRYMAANVGPMGLTAADGELREQLERARELVPEGARAIAVGAHRAIEQVSGGLVTFHVQVPPGGRFRAELAHTGGAEVGAAFRLYGTGDDRRRELLGEALVPAGDETRELAVDLSDRAGELLELALVLAAADGTADASGEVVTGAWYRAALSGSAAPELERGYRPPPDVDRRLEELRAVLQGAPVVAILLDACNPDFLGAYGGGGDTPHLDRLAGEGLLFHEAYATAAYTVASVGSMLTSKYTWEHGAWQGVVHHVLPNMPAWPAAFRDAGYRTNAIMMSPNGSGKIGFDRGFERTFEPQRGTSVRWPPLAEEALASIDEVLNAGDGRPLFLWMHIVEPHEPYHPPAPFRGSHDVGYEGPLTADSRGLGAIRQYRVLPDEQEIAHIKGEYRDNLQYVDAVVGRMRARLEEAGIWRDAVVLVFSDHSEAFLDHRGKSLQAMGHGSTVYDDMVRIPLIVGLPEEARRLVAGDGEPRALVSGLDLLPTVADLVGIPPDAVPGRGLSFAPLLAGAEEARSSLTFHTSSFSARRFLPCLGIRLGPYKAVKVPGEPVEVYDLEADPEERRNLAAERPALGGYLHRRLREATEYSEELSGWSRSLGDFEQIELDEETLESLRALGYVSDEE